MEDNSEEQKEIASSLYGAYRSGTPLSPLREKYELTLSDAYRLQKAVTERRRSGEGPRVGYKVGFTSEAIQNELDINEPAYGHLLADTLQSDGRINLEPLIEPKVEAELAIRLEEPITGPVTTAEILTATKAVVPVIEIVDSRIDGWNVTAAEAIADNALSGRVICGDRIFDPSSLDTNLALEGIRVRKNGVQEATGVGADVLGHPCNAVRWLARSLRDRDDRLEAGDIVLTGSVTPLIPLAPDDFIEVQFATFGTVTVRGT
ncbi:2-keto-4-pentenoate hydratase [Haloterrigena alkaliphila]|uniref:Fumarylacetoacetate hydrolase family protein n=1 Tax=Haloterrigena alkaliphila TaxID=2816475 RepID=A0A8A2VA83_9EURY|nr:fumarylacetoacetate hydrolase family protein [Haloterrigena alkaliphila]QSW97630.1 fumarylacetoacetate hydrolase family protein [Haloterrigena alkaliphila]